MNKLTKIALAVLVVLVLFMSTPFAVGWFVPVDHVASSRATYAQPPEEVWNALSDFATWSEWSSSFDAVERQEDRGGKPYWVAQGSWGPMPMVVDVFEPPRRMVTVIPDDADLGFYGSWTYVVEAAEGGSTVTITEAGTTPGALMRGIMKLMPTWDYHTAMNAVLTDLGSRFGEAVEPVELE